MKDTVDLLIERHGADAVTRAVLPMLTDDRIARIDTVLNARLSGLTVVIENLHDPHNGAAAIRSIEAVGITKLHVVETVERFRAASAVTIGAEKWIDVARHNTFEMCAAQLQEAGFTLYAACPEAALDIESIDVTRPSAIVFGNEHAGLTNDAIQRCDHKITIPMHGFTQSFNLSVSVAVTMHRLAARRRASLATNGDLDEGKRAFLRARWYALGVRGIDAIVARYVSEQTR